MNNVPGPTFGGWTWHAHFAELHRFITEERWLEVAMRLSVMLTYVLDKATKGRS